VAQIRILLAGMPRMLRAIIAELINSQLDMRVVAEVGRDGALRDLARQLEPDMVILGVDGQEIPAEARELVRERPSTKVLAVEATGRRAWLYELRPHLELIGEISNDALLEAIRTEPLAAEGPLS